MTTQLAMRVICLLFLAFRAGFCDDVISFLVSIEQKFCSEPVTCTERDSPPPEATTSQLLPTGGTNPDGYMYTNSLVTKNETDMSYDDFPLKPPPFERGCCSTCSCDRATCFEKDTCCLDVIGYLPPVSDSLNRLKATCAPAQLRTDTDSDYFSNPSSMKMIRTCPLIATLTSDDIEVEDKCNNYMNYTELHAHIPVLDTTTEISYHNMYCARCHGIRREDIMFWNAEVKCRYDAYTSADTETLIDDIRKSKGCNIIYNYLTGWMPPTCNADLITTCNETGKWRIYNPWIEKACLAYTAVYDFDYKNIFCYMCNTDRSIGEAFCQALPSPNVFSTFVLLLNVPTTPNVAVQTETGATCIENQVFDLASEHCIHLTCFFPWTFRNGRCEQLYDQINGMTFTMFFTIRPENTKTFVVSEQSEIYWQQFIIKMKNTIIQIIDNTSLTSSLVDEIMFYKDDNANDLFKPFDIEYLIVYTRFDIFGFRYINVMDFKKVFDLNDKINNISIDGQQTFEFKTSLEHRLDILPSLKLYDVINNQSLNMSVLNVPSNKSRGVLDAAVKLTKFHNCVLVPIEVNAADARMDQGIYIHLYGCVISYTDVYWEGSWTNTSFPNIMYVCNDTFHDIMSNYSLKGGLYYESVRKPSAYTGAGVLSLVCISLSMVCSAAVLVTYTCLADLRTQPGYNNMALAAHLIIAQSLLQFGSDQAENVSQQTCQAIGVLIHYFWLVVIMWMNVCTIHMFKIFHNMKACPKQSNKLRATVYYLLYCYGIAAIPVSALVISSWVASDGIDIGYGENICYITEQNKVLLFFVVPLSLVVLCNLVLFVIVMVQINRTSAGKDSSSYNRNLPLVYAKMSTLTGIVWIVSFVYIISNQTWLEYVVIVLNGSQGVFLFIAFICNRNVFINLNKKWLSSINSV